MNDKHFTEEITLQKIYSLLLSMREEIQRLSSAVRGLSKDRKEVNTVGKKI